MYRAILGGTEQSCQGRLLSHSTWCWWGCTWSRVSYFLSPCQKNVGKLERVLLSLEDYQDVLRPRADVLGSVNREVEETGLFLSIREKAKRQSNSSLQLPKGQFQRQ